MRTLKEIMGEYLSEGTGHAPRVINEMSIFPPSPDPGCPISVSEGQWETVSDPTRYKKEFNFDNSKMLIDFINEVLMYQEMNQHHGRITISPGSVMIEVYTHDVNTVTEIDQEYTHEVDNIFIDVEYSNINVPTGDF